MGCSACCRPGRGNDFARRLDLPTTPEAQAELFLAGPTRQVDLVDWDGRLVAGSVYAGVDARAAEIVGRTRLLPASMQYPYAAIRSLATYRPGRYRVAIDGDVREYAAATVAVANSAYDGKGMLIAPAAALSDGLLDVVVIEAALRVALMRALPSVYDGSHVERDGVHVLIGRRIELGGRARRPIPVGGDGEPLGVLPDLDEEPAVAEVRPGALTVLA